jgi:hypothetical protein
MSRSSGLKVIRRGTDPPDADGTLRERICVVKRYTFTL